jgi:flagellar export protein FliJ
MKSLQTLIELTESKVEEVQRVLAKFLAHIDALDTEKADLERRVYNSVQDAGDDPTLHDMAARFAARARVRIEQITVERAQTEDEAAKVKDELRDLFAEQKRYEILEKRRKEEEKRTRAARDQARLDETARNGFLRRQDDPES